MQRKATSNTRAANATERAHMSWIKDRGICAACVNDGGVIVHHCVGSTYKVTVGLERVLIGHAFVLGLCACCDAIVTRGTHKAFREKFGAYAELFKIQYSESPVRLEEIVLIGIYESGK